MIDDDTCFTTQRFTRMTHLEVAPRTRRPTGRNPLSRFVRSEDERPVEHLQPVSDSERCTVAPR